MGYTTWDYEVPYARINTDAYARMDPSSPGSGVAVDCVLTDLVVVMHCHSTKRTVVAHVSALGVAHAAYIPMIDWITGGPDTPRYSNRPTWHELNAFYSGLDVDGTKPTPTKIDIVVLRGSIYHAVPNVAQSIFHEEWIRLFRVNITDMLRGRGATAKIVNSLVLKSGAVLIDKGSAKLTVIATSHATPSGMPPIPVVFIQSHEIPTKHTDAQYAHIVLTSTLELSRLPAGGVPVVMEYDGRVHIAPRPLSTEARVLLRSARQGLSPLSRALLSLVSQRFYSKYFGDFRWIKNRSYRAAMELNLYMAATQPCCELCGEDGIWVCPFCRGAWYCT